MKKPDFYRLNIMNLLSPALGLAVILHLTGCSSQKVESPEMEAVQSFQQMDYEINRGVNISHWLSQSRRRGEERKNFIQKEDIDFIASVGYDHIRIPIDEEQMWDSLGNKESEAFGLLHNGIQWAAENGLRVVVDLHILRSHHFNEAEKPLWTDPAAQEQFFNCWRDLSEELISYPNGLVAYELMNEPVADDPEEWNVLVEKALAVVRRNEPERKVVIGSNRWQSVDTFDDLRVPENDPHIILSFHFYTPFIVTHYTASWTGIAEYEGSVKYPGLTLEDEDLVGLEGELYERIKNEQKFYTRDSLEALMAPPIRKAARYGLPLYCGEWGALPTINEESRMNWYRDMRFILEKNGIAWANWDYKGGFGIVDRNVDEPFNDLIEILVGD
jgi:endoglucanase